MKSLLSVLLLLFVAASIQADTVYKYRDADGQWWFTDKKPKNRAYDTIQYQYDGTQKYRSEQQGKTDRRIRVTMEGHGAARKLVAVNSFLAPVQIRITPKNFTMPVTEFVIPAKSAQVLFQPEAADIAKYRYTYRWNLGDHRVQPTAFLYLPPVQLGRGFKVSQGFNGRYSHFKDGNRYAIDVAMPEGTGIRAARDGVVVEAEDRHSATSKGSWNYVRVLHDDATIAVYGHLMHRGLLVKEGDKVKMGQVIARSGNTGFSTGPHLHFALQRNAGMKTMSIPFHFRNEKGDSFVPETGQLVSSFRLPSFEEQARN